MMKYSTFAFRLILGGFFLFSAYQKTFPIINLQIHIMEIFSWMSWDLAKYMAYSLISIEFFIGGVILLGYHQNRNLKYSIYLFLLLMSIFLLFQIYFRPNIEDCGCLGLAYKISPLEGLVKNIVLTVLFYFLCRIDSVNNNLTLLVFIPLILISIGYPIYLNIFTTTNDKIAFKQISKYHFPFEYLSPYCDSSKMADIQKGKWVFVLLSLSCNKCEQVAKHISLINNSNPNLNLFILYSGEQNNLSSFISKYRLSNIRSIYINNVTDMIILSGNKVPQYLWVDNGTVIKKTSLSNTSTTELVHWLSEKN